MSDIQFQNTTNNFSIPIEDIYDRVYELLSRLDEASRRVESVIQSFDLLADQVRYWYIYYRRLHDESRGRMPSYDAISSKRWDRRFRSHLTVWHAIADICKQLQCHPVIWIYSCFSYYWLSADYIYPTHCLHVSDGILNIVKSCKSMDIFDIAKKYARKVYDLLLMAGSLDTYWRMTNDKQPNKSYLSMLRAVMSRSEKSDSILQWLVFSLFSEGKMVDNSLYSAAINQWLRDYFVSQGRPHGQK